MGSLSGPTQGPERLITSIRIGLGSAQAGVSVQRPRNSEMLPVQGFWDTGADVVVVDKYFVDRLGLDMVGFMGVNVGADKRLTPTYPINVELTFADESRVVIEDALCIADQGLRARQEYGLLIGRPIFDNLVFLYNGPEGKFSVWDKE